MDYALINKTLNTIIDTKLNQPVAPVVNDTQYAWLPLSLQPEPVHDSRTEKLVAVDTVTAIDAQRSWSVVAKTVDEVADYDRSLLPLISVNGFQLAAALQIKGYTSVVNAELALPGNELLKIAFDRAPAIHSNDKRIIDVATKLNLPIYEVFQLAVMIN